MFKSLNRFFKFCNAENSRKFKVSIILSVIASLINALKIPAIAVLIDAILKNNIDTSSIVTSLLLMLISILGTSMINYHANMLQTEAGYDTAAKKRIDIAEHMRYLPMGYFNENSLGQITSVTTNTMENLADVGTRVVMFITEGILTTLVITLITFFFDYRIGLIIVLGLILFYIANTLLQKASENVSIKKVATDTEVVSKVLEYIKGISEVKAYHLSGKYNKKLNNAINENVDANTKMEITLIPYITLQNIIAKAIGVIITVISIYFYTTNSLSLLNTIMFLICSFIIMEGLERAGMNSTLLRTVDLCVTKAQKILDIPEMDIEGEDIIPENYDLSAKNISFAYEEKNIINNISADIKSHTTTALVGPSGGGKTTFCNLLSRFWDVDSGIVTLGGKDIKDYSLDSLMKNFSFVFQNVYLFKDTVANNIRFGQPDAPMEKVIEASKKAKCHDFIMALPNGYDTIIGENGHDLSGGERQRLSIARAIMKDSPIIILDEATANVDPENEKDLLFAIEELTKEKTIIMIAHRLKTVKNADKIFVIDKGRIAETGTHKELLSNNGIYSRFIGERKQAVSFKITK